MPAKSFDANITKSTYHLKHNIFFFQYICEGNDKTLLKTVLLVFSPGSSQSVLIHTCECEEKDKELFWTHRRKQFYEFSNPVDPRNGNRGRMCVNARTSNNSRELPTKPGR